MCHHLCNKTMPIVLCVNMIPLSSKKIFENKFKYLYDQLKCYIIKIGTCINKLYLHFLQEIFLIGKC